MPGDFRQARRSLRPLRPVGEAGQVDHDDEFLAVRANPCLLADQAGRRRVTDRSVLGCLIPQHLPWFAEREGVRASGSGFSRVFAMSSADAGALPVRSQTGITTR